VESGFKAIYFHSDGVTVTITHAQRIRLHMILGVVHIIWRLKQTARRESVEENQTKITIIVLQDYGKVA
jgi:hypothetical protein